jgi:hypothetical protein
MGPGSGAARTTAIHNNERSAVAPDTPPSSTQSCPYMKELRLGVFFDGTGNNKYVDLTDGHETNVVRLFIPYKDQSDDRIIRNKLYLVGVGAGEAPARHAGPTQGHNEPGRIWGQNWVRGSTGGDRWSDHQSNEGTGTAGGAFGKGATDRLNRAYDWVKAHVRRHSQDHMADSLKLIDLYGFSRGAMLARTFNNLVNQALKREQPTELFRNIEVRFLGVFDTVDSTYNVEVNMGLDSGDFRGARHFTARDEIRENFPLTLLGTNDIEYAGVHSDVGGGYANCPVGPNGQRIPSHDPLDEAKSNWLAGPPLWDMYQASLRQGVEFLTDPTLPGGMSHADLEQIRADSDRYDGTHADRSTPEAQRWRNTYVHRSDSTGIGMAPRSVPVRDSRGRLRSEYRREVVRVRKFTLKTMPPSFSWNS